MISCFTKHFGSFTILALGRIFAGIGASLLFSVFETWMLKEHSLQGFKPISLKQTLAKAWSYNALVAVAAGNLYVFFLCVFVCDTYKIT